MESISGNQRIGIDVNRNKVEEIKNKIRKKKKNKTKEVYIWSSEIWACPSVLVNRIRTTLKYELRASRKIC